MAGMPPPPAAAVLQVVSKLGGTIDDSQMVEGLVLDLKAGAVCVCCTRVLCRCNRCRDACEPAVRHRRVVQAAEEHYSLPPGTRPFEYLPVEEVQQQQPESEQEQVRRHRCCSAAACSPGTTSWRGRQAGAAAHRTPVAHCCAPCLCCLQYAATTEQEELMWQEHQLQQQQQQQEGSEASEGSEARDEQQWAEAAADLAYDGAVHQQYLDLPPWPATTHDELAVSWRRAGTAGGGGGGLEGLRACGERCWQHRV